MVNKTRKKNRAKMNKNPSKASLQELYTSRDGGQIALKGFTYQFLYSCLLILSEPNPDTVFHLEGIEDIDRITRENSSESIMHIQLKYSTQKQDASFLKDVMASFLETYLFDRARCFKLVYDFQVAKGNLSKLFDLCLDDSSKLYWKGIIKQIEKENPLWDWSGFVFDDFVSKLYFEKIEKTALEKEIKVKLIQTYDIVTGNVLIFCNGIKIYCLEKMESRDTISKHELDTVIQNIKDDIGKGVRNPAYNWIKRIEFSDVQNNTDLSFFEGKKPTPQDISQHLPIRRHQIEGEIEKAIQDNRIIVIKASSGQGKTTIALQVAYNLQNEYQVYQLLWCNDSKELNNIVHFFKSRVMVGEKPLILIDNLDSQLSEWNRLAQLLQEDLPDHYKLLLTTREDDWYSYSGDLSGIRALNVVNLKLNEDEAKRIYKVLSDAKMLHSSITDWQKSWFAVANKQLLIEYIYLLTHGEMLSERIAYQLKQIGNTITGKIKFEILRKVCFADICGARLSVSKLRENLSEVANTDYSELLKSIENEFLVRVDSTEKYIEGLHPVRSQHIVDKLHEFTDLDETALQVIQISEASYFSKIFSKLPQLLLSKKTFYSKVIDTIWNDSDLSYYVLALRGVFSGSVTQYFLHLRDVFDDANDHGGLYLLAMGLNPFTRWKEIDYSLQTLDEMKKIMPDNRNIQYLCDIKDTAPKIGLPDTDIYNFCEALFNKLNKHKLFDITDDVASYSSIAHWLININPNFNLSMNISLEELWDDLVRNKAKYLPEVFSSTMYTCFCGNKDDYMSFVNANLMEILVYLKEVTNSLKIYCNENDEGKKEIHVEYILLPSDIEKGNEESVSRLTTICKTLPIYDTYCADSLKPTIEVLSRYSIPDDAHKTMPIENIVIMFHHEFISLWSNTIMSNYECDSSTEWLEHWFLVRKNILALFRKSADCIYKLLEAKPLRGLATEVDNLRIMISNTLIKELKYPFEERPFDEKARIPEEFIQKQIKSDYFQSANNFFNQIQGILRRDEDMTRLALLNLSASKSALKKMQDFFGNVANEQESLQQQHFDLCVFEEQSIENLLAACLYYQEHQPSKYFSKYIIKNWYSEYNNNIMVCAKKALLDLSSMYDVVFPTDYYQEGILSFFPLIVLNLNLTDGESLMKFLCLCIPFEELSFDYLVVVYGNNHNKVMPTGLKITKSFLEQLKDAIDSEDTTLIDQMTPLFPAEITTQVIECFNDYYEVLTPISSKYEGLDRIGELLWSFSLSRDTLSDVSDEVYREHILTNIKTQIQNLLAIKDSQIPHTDFVKLSQLCYDIFSGQKFDDISINEFYERLISKSAEQIMQ